MFNERNIPKLIILTPILTIIILVSLVLYSFIKTQRNYFLQESIQLEKTYMTRQKAALQKEINDVFQYIHYHKNLMLNNEKKDIKIQMKAFVKLLTNSSTTQRNYPTYIQQNSNDDTDFIIYDMRYNHIIKDKNVFFNQDMIHKHENLDGTFILQDETNLLYFREIASKNILIILKKDIFNKVDDLKNSIARWVEQIRFEEGNYLWIYSNTNKLIANPYRKEDIGKDDTYKKDIKDTFFVQKLVRLAIKNPEGRFFEFYSSTLQQKTDSKQLGFAKLYREWNWVIGCGVGLNEIHNNLDVKKLLLEKRINKYIKTTILIAFLLILVISLLSILISYRISRTFRTYQNKVNKKEIKLKYLNRHLHNKIEVALQEAKEKDRAMLHQSRLARMGNMLNMISHQWRQPLSQLAGIMMELEATVRFKKADDKFLYSCANDATRIIQFMSLTIEDFRHFFKPDRDKEDFHIVAACKDAIGLIKDSLSDQKIVLIFNIKNDKKVNGYKREYSQVILNLLLNAKDAIIMNHIQEGTITITVDTQDDLSILTVQDNAGGVPEGIIDQIFEPYFSTKKSQGTGLGLYMSKMIIEKNMQGRINVKNEKNGALFTILL